MISGEADLNAASPIGSQMPRTNQRADVGPPKGSGEAVEPELTSGLRTTLSLLAEHLVRQSRAARLGDRDVLVDIELDGVRCLVVRSAGAPGTARPTARAHTEELSPREQEIARMIAEGYPNKTIAAVLDISSWTVNTYLRRIFAKLAVSSRAAMVAKLAKARLRS